MFAQLDHWLEMHVKPGHQIQISRLLARNSSFYSLFAYRIEIFASRHSLYLEQLRKLLELAIYNYQDEQVWTEKQD